MRRTGFDGKGCARLATGSIAGTTASNARINLETPSMGLLLIDFVGVSPLSGF
jgi:hypothetical protein